ncbi:MAG: hypothetical protein JO337_08475 [Acidimicrobiales bacterium]|nr:hypothetical protein [Acidimicrobiales bacterium]
MTRVAPREHPEGTKADPVASVRTGGAPLAQLWRPVAVLVAARLVMGAGMWAYQHVTHQYPINHWDGGWYVLAAQHGWPHHVKTGLGDAGQDTLAFFPGFPTVIRVVHFALPLSWLRAGEVAAFLTQVAMVAGMWLLARDVWGDEVADRTSVVLCFFPAAFVFAIMYSESMLMAASAFCLLALRRQKWLLAGALAAVATATRLVGIAVVVCCAWEAFQAVRKGRKWRALLSVPLGAAGVVGWFAYLWASTGDAKAWLDTERNGWAQHTSLLAIPRLVKSVLHTHPADPNQVLALAGTGLGIILLVTLVVSRAPIMLSLYSLAVLVISATSVNPSGIRFRFVMTAFPLLMVVAYRLKDAAFSVVVAGSAVVMSAMMVVTLTGGTLIP